MHKDDKMTPLERAAALARGEDVDRFPINMFYGAPAHAMLGWTRQQEFADGRSIARVQKKVYETFGCDGVSASYGLHGMAVAFGAKISDDPHLPSSILEHPIKDIRDLSMLDLEKVTVKTDPTAKKCYEAVHILQDELGHEVGCGMGLTGAFTCASGLVGPENLLKAIIKYPEQVHRLLEFTTKAILLLAEPFVREGYGMMISDPMVSGTILSKKHFREFVLPYSQCFVEGCKSFGPIYLSTHICGDTTGILEDIVECGYKTISLDNRVDLAVAKRRIGSQVHLMGNVDPVEVMYCGTTDMVRAAIKTCCRKAWDSPRGYTIATGCDTVYGMPMENAYAFMEEARKCARYPMIPENFM
ncbi:uroporphyrinogen decarboxylase family protein [Dehalobacterium formicoaceticum]|uniref:Uroporphyrinogen decarboxylase family protein n=1 Tax=Dehalobacterium formicoaceticum TaxID=51515 RepID=A0ABT1Y4D9_9FIRM|nr:uroporphyrinogen decarboxylase family protein [Dehalobacterium formicoaceticum]MCR6545747.1 uroporphyrinogen decarboxylase family protein [Dehalobacterium formicoaceticum]